MTWCWPFVTCYSFFCVLSRDHRQRLWFLPSNNIWEVEFFVCFECSKNLAPITRLVSHQMRGTCFACMRSHSALHTHTHTCIDKSTFKIKLIHVWWSDVMSVLGTPFRRDVFQQNACSLHMYYYYYYYYYYYHLLKILASSEPSFRRKPNTSYVYVSSVYLFLAWALQRFVGWGFFNHVIRSLPVQWQF